MKISFVFNAFQNSRYSGFSWNNARGVPYGPRIFRFGAPAVPAITFADLIAAVRERYTDAKGVLSQSGKNRLTALSRVLEILRLSPEDDAAALRPAVLPTTLELVRSCGEFKPARSADIQSHCRGLSTLLREIEAGAASMRPVKARPDSAFTQALKAAFIKSGLTKSEVASRAHMSPMTFGDWLRGRQPFRTTHAAVSAVESVLILPQGSLVDLLANAKSVAEPSVRVAEYRSRVAAWAKEPYRVRISEATPRFIAQWREFFRYKTAVKPDLARSPASGWTTKAIGSTKTVATIATEIDGRVCPSAHYNWMRVTGMLGYLRKYGAPLCSPDRDDCVPERLPLDNESAQTMAWLAVPEAVEAFLCFMRDRANKFNSGARNFSIFVASLVGERFGWLYQQPRLILSLPSEAVQGRTWAELCAQTLAIAFAYVGKYDGPSRKSGDAIADVLADKDPLAKLLSVVVALDAEAARWPSGSRNRATAKRDALMVAILSCLPIRSESLASLNVVNNEEFGYFSRDASGRYRVQVFVSKTRGTESGGEYDAKLPESLTPRVDEYLREFRPILVRDSGSPYLLPSSSHPMRIWRTLNSQVFTVIRRHLSESPGFGPHSFRHLVCTVYLREHPDEEIVVAALLGITVATLHRHYYEREHERAVETQGNAVTAAMLRAKRASGTGGNAARGKGS